MTGQSLCKATNCVFALLSVAMTLLDEVRRPGLHLARLQRVRVATERLPTHALGVLDIVPVKVLPVQVAVEA